MDNVKDQVNSVTKCALIDMVAVKDSDNTLKIISKFREVTSNNLDYGSGSVPEYAVVYVGRNDIDTFSRYVDFLTSDPSCPDYVHRRYSPEYYVTDDGKAVDVEGGDEDTPILWLSDNRFGSDVVKEQKTRIGRDVYGVVGAQVNENDGFTPDIEEIVVSHKGKVFATGNIDGQTWEVYLPDVETLKTILDTGSVGDIF